jgi:hypothetical protein
MKQAIFLIAALLLPACDGELETATFGLKIDYTKDGMWGGAGCSLGGENSEGSSSATLLDDKVKPNGDFVPPNLWLEELVAGVGEESAYDVRAYLATAYDERNLQVTSMKVLVERHYDKAFGNGGKKDSFYIDFEGVAYDITVTGLPEGTKECPFPLPDDPDAGLPSDP